jgi:hypothetical protein
MVSLVLGLKMPLLGLMVPFFTLELPLAFRDVVAEKLIGVVPFGGFS